MMRCDWHPDRPAVDSWREDDGSEGIGQLVAVCDECAGEGPRLDVAAGEQTALTADPPPLPADPPPAAPPAARLFDAPATIRGQLAMDECA